MKFAELKTKAAQKERIRSQLGTSIAWASKGVVRVYENQTQDEQAIEGTVEHNGIGFTGVDANILSSFAKQILKGRTMSAKQSAILFKKMPKYAGQLQRMVQVVKPTETTEPTEPTKPTELNYAAFEDEDLLTEFHSLQSSIQYYEAAEGNYGKETNDRNQCYKDFNRAVTEAEHRGLL